MTQQMNQQSPSTNPQEADQAEISTDMAAPLVVRVPAQLPVLTVQVSRALLALLAELTKIGVLDGPPAEGRSDVD
ncbi:MAG TPA: hypothetical protein VK735_42135 [Pseudonocardia sp.]|uniref:hypothetical protein n=1 Tax=Pseudonocardia sp. TaxID=60912 RepID=UPI002B546DF3|nr:hypothetical protein [Pseudonocardia sp.]HTF54089.1 hypothetical protein [Pseudonocardia sp.]